MFGSFNSGASQPGNSGLFGNNNNNNNTGGGLFGQAPKPAASSQSTGLFGSNPQPNTSNSLFGNNTSTNPPPSGGLFGAKPSGTTPAPLFGNNTANQQPIPPVTPTPTTGGLFGNKLGGANATPTFGQNNNSTNTSGGLFGSSNNASTQGGGLFNNNANATNNTQTGGLFGNSNQSGGLFGNTNNNKTGTGLGAGNNTQPGGGLFGSKPAGGSLFNSQPQQAQFQPQQPNNTFGAPNPSQQQQQQPPNQPLITPFTRPTDLPEPFQQELEKMDLYIRQQMQLSEDLNQKVSDHRTDVTSVPRDVQLLKFKLSCAKETLKFDDDKLAKLKSLVDKDYSDVELLTNVTNEPRKYDRLLPYFKDAVNCEDRIAQLAMAMSDVQQVITAEEFGKRVTYDDQGIQALPRAIKEEYMYFMSLSDLVAELHRHIEEKGEVETFEEMQT